MKNNKPQFSRKCVAAIFPLFACIMQAYGSDFTSGDASVTNLTKHILAIEADNPAPFNELDDIIHSWYTLEGSNKSRGNRPGVFVGILRQFTSRCPETNMVSEGSLYSTSNGVIRMTHKNVRKYSDAEVLAGQRRNQATRMAVLKHVTTKLTEDGQYEQTEFLNFILDTWGKNRYVRSGDHLVTDRIDNFDEIVQNLMENEKLVPSMRINAALYLRDTNGIDVLPVLRRIVTNLPSEEPSPELFKSLQKIRGFLPEVERALRDFGMDGSTETNVDKGHDRHK